MSFGEFWSVLVSFGQFWSVLNSLEIRYNLFTINFANVAKKKNQQNSGKIFENFRKFCKNTANSPDIAKFAEIPPKF